jgi:hypothetical protein
MRFVVDDQTVLPSETSVMSTSVGSVAVTGEKKSATDHVDGSDDDRGAGGIGLPLLIVGKLPAQSTDREKRTIVESAHPSESLSHGTECWVGLGRNRLKAEKPFPQHLGNGCRLINHGPTVDYVDEPSREKILHARSDLRCEG